MSGLNFRSVLAGCLTALALTGCAISTPFKGPGYDDRRGAIRGDASSVTVAVTLATLNSEWGNRRTFFQQVKQVESSLGAQPGLIGYSIRTELLGSNNWTLTVWESEDALRAFVEGIPHQDAIRDGKGALATARFVRFSTPSRDIPLSWDKALQIIERDGRTYRWVREEID